MKTEELKEKILSLVRGAMLEADDLPFIEATENITDALIVAGVVDKSDYASMKETAVRYKAEVSKAGARVKEAEAEANRYEMLYKLQNRDMALAERRAHDAEHRAEVAERALKNFAENITCEDCPFFSDCASSEKMEDLIHSNYCFAEYLRQAKKELAEEGKDGNETD